MPEVSIPLTCDEITMIEESIEIAIGDEWDEIPEEAQERIERVQNKLLKSRGDIC